MTEPSQTPLGDYLLRLAQDDDARLAFRDDPDGEMSRAGIAEDVRNVIHRGVEAVRDALWKEQGKKWGRDHVVVLAIAGTDESPPRP